MSPFALFLPMVALAAAVFAEPAPADAAGKEKPAASGIDALEVVKVVQVPFRLRLMAIDWPPKITKPSDVAVQINTVGSDRTLFLPVGGDIPNTKFKIDSIEQKEIPDKDGTTKDVSAVTLVNKETGAKVVLPLKQIVDSPETHAIFRYKWRQRGAPITKDFAKRLGETFTLPPETKKEYKVIEIKKDGVTVELPDGSKKLLPVPK